MLRGGRIGGGAAIALLVVLLACVTSPAAGGHTAGAAFQSADRIDPDTALLDVTVGADGDARWEIRYRVRLDDDNATAAFESLERDIEANRSAYADQFEGRIRNTVWAAENATGRDMAIRNVSVGTSRQEIPQRYGVLVYSFEWTNFAAIDGDRIGVGDAIGGLYLDGATSLTVRWPAGYDVDATDPAPDEIGDRSVTWRGPADFTAEQPSLRLVPSEAGSTETTAGGSDSAGGGGVPTTLLALGAIVGLSLVAGGGWYWHRRRPRRSDPVTTEPSPEPERNEPPEELLSNEERVLDLLRRNGGRMKQQQVIEELGWTDAKTSQVVGELREAGEVEAFRLGRENVLRLSEAGDGPLE